MVGGCAVWHFCCTPKIWRNIVPPASGLKNIFLWNVKQRGRCIISILILFGLTVITNEAVEPGILNLKWVWVTDVLTQLYEMLFIIQQSQTWATRRNFENMYDKFKLHKICTLTL
jgi:hypothetical protein